MPLWDGIISMPGVPLQPVQVSSKLLGVHFYNGHSSGTAYPPNLWPDSAFTFKTVSLWELPGTLWSDLDSNGTYNFSTLAAIIAGIPSGYDVVWVGGSTPAYAGDGTAASVPDNTKWSAFI